MSNSKISALTSATTPLAGTEVLPIVQSSTTKQVSVANLTAGRTQTSNGIVQGTAATGYNFTANTPAAGMTSQLLNWYEEGTWTPSVSSTVGTITLLGAVSGTYTRIGRRVFINFSIAITTNGTAAGRILVSGLPFTISGFGSGSGRENGVNGYMIQSAGFNGATQFYILTYLGLYPGGNGYLLEGFMEYQV
jgi:hypothetical protein